MRMVERLSPVLNIPVSYRIFQRRVGAESAWRTYRAEYVKLVPGEKVLDIGCGPADFLNYLPAINDTGST